MLSLHLYPIHHQIVFPHVIVDLLGNEAIPLKLALQKL